jgi:hypothetical protein
VKIKSKQRAKMLFTYLKLLGYFILVAKKVMLLSADARAVVGEGQDPLEGVIKQANTLRRYAEVRFSRVPDVDGLDLDTRQRLSSSFLSFCFFCLFLQLNIFADVALDALESLWPEMELQIPDALSSSEKNREVRRRLPWLAIEVWIFFISKTPFPCAIF